MKYLFFTLLALNVVTAQASQQTKPQQAPVVVQVKFDSYKGAIRNGDTIELRDGNKLCRINDDLAKRMKVSFELIWDLMATRRIDVTCFFHAPVKRNSQPYFFTLRTYLDAKE